MHVPLKTYLNLVLESRNSGDFDAVILNLENSFTENVGIILGKCSDCIVLAMQDAISAAKTACFLRNVDLSASRFLLVCNRYDPQRPNELPENKEICLPVGGYIYETEHAEIEAIAGEKGLTEIGYGFL